MIPETRVSVYRKERSRPNVDGRRAVSLQVGDGRVVAGDNDVVLGSSVGLVRLGFGRGRSTLRIQRRLSVLHLLLHSLLVPRQSPLSTVLPAFSEICS